jgi:urea transport system permease protein
MLFFTLGGYCFGLYLCMHGKQNADGVPDALARVSSKVGTIDLPWFWHPFEYGILGLIAVFVVPGLVAYLFGWLAFRSRVRGVYFSIITQALTYIGVNVFRLNQIQLCGTNGLTDFETMFGFNVRSDNVKTGLAVLTIVVLAGAYALSRLLVSTRSGRVLVAVRDSEMRLRFAGYQPVAYKTAIFTLGAIFAAVGGALYVPQNGIITPAKMDPSESILIVIMVALGGRGTLSGAIIGSLLISYLLSWLTSAMPDYWQFVLGALFIKVTLFFPGGIVGGWRALGVWLAQPKPAVNADPTLEVEAST